MKEWRCTVCGYIHEGSEPPRTCPICGADKSKFVLVEPDRTEAPQTRSPVPEKDVSPKPYPFADIAARAIIVTRLHGHPIAVHIPNGVLPLSVLLTILAFMFRSDAIATAAKINMWFICLSMPIVLTTGLIDWFNRYEGRMTQIFSVKMVCGAIVTFLTAFLSVWWIFSPEVYLAGVGKGGFFLLLNLLNLTAAAVAGFYGGKLVFNE